MDLSKFNIEKMAEQGANLDLLDPIEDMPLGTEEKPVFITLLGTDSKVYRNKNLAFQRERIAKMARKRSKTIDYTVSEEQSCEMLAACTIGWEGLEIDGEELEFSPEAAFDLYMEHVWIREQVDVFIADRANFFTKS